MSKFITKNLANAFKLVRVGWQCNRAIHGVLTLMAAAEEKAFLRAAVAAIPRITEIISGFPPDDRAGAFEIAKRRFMAAALDFGCTEIGAQTRVSAVMQRLRRRVQDRQDSEKKLQALLNQLTKSK